jgi:quinol monooxygenase YgiN
MLSTDRRTFVRTAGASAATAAAFLSIGPANAADDAIYVIAELVSKPDKADDLRKLLVEFVAGARKEPGCKHYSLLEDRKQAGRFLTFETWADQAAIEAHMTTPAIKAAGPKLEPILAKPFTQEFLMMVSDGLHHDGESFRSAGSCALIANRMGVLGGAHSCRPGFLGEGRGHAEPHRAHLALQTGLASVGRNRRIAAPSLTARVDCMG